jgi:hypothetical protein
VRDGRVQLCEFTPDEETGIREGSAAPLELSAR